MSDMHVGMVVAFLKGTCDTTQPLLGSSLHHCTIFNTAFFSLMLGVSDLTRLKLNLGLDWMEPDTLAHAPQFWVLREPGSCSTCVTSVPNMQKLGLMNYKTSMTPILVQSSSEKSCLVATRRIRKMSNFVETQKMGMQIPIRQIPEHDTLSQDTNTFSGI
jgi:hypothetical protein